MLYIDWGKHFLFSPFGRTLTVTESLEAEFRLI